MLTREHLDQAVAKGVITPEQAVALLGLAGTSPAAVAEFAGEPGEELFRIANGFNEVFIALGVIMLVFGMYASLGMNSIAMPKQPYPGWIAFLATGCLIVLWLLSEFLTGRRRMLAPSIVLVFAMCGFGLVAAGAVLSMLNIGFNQRGSTAKVPWQLLLLPCGALLVSGLHYARFRFPFSLQLVAASLIGVVAAVLAIVVPEFALENFKPIMFGLGLCVFAAALAFDLSDPQRQTNRSDGGFWLHMIAAPLIVHPLMPRRLDGAGIVFAVFAVLALVAIVVDRRAILVASLSYLMAAIGYLASQRGLNVAQIFFAIPLVVGIGIIALGTGWQAVRHGVWAVLPGTGPLERLRPRSP